MRKVMKSKGWIMIFMIMVFISIFTINSCKPWPRGIKGTGIWGESKYGEAVFGKEGKGNISEDLRSWNSNKE